MSEFAIFAGIPPWLHKMREVSFARIDLLG